MKTKILVALLCLSIAVSCVPTVVASTEQSQETPWLVATNSDYMSLWAIEILEKRGPVSDTVYRRCYFTSGPANSYGMTYSGGGIWCSDLYPHRSE